MSEVLDNLKTARRLLYAVGVTQGDLYTEGEGYCALGAVTAAKFDLCGADVHELTRDDDRYPYHDAANAWPELEALHDSLPLDYRNSDKIRAIFGFNDRSGRELILAWFDRTIEALEEQ
jgi:hypothetical protein